MSEPSIATSAARDQHDPRPRISTAAIWLSIAALVLCALLVLPYTAQSSPAFVPVFALAVAAGIAGIVLGLLARRSSSDRRGWALFCALAAMLLAVVLAVIFAVGMISTTSINKVELRGQGPEGISATFSNEMERRTEEWPPEGWARFNTKGSWAELTIEVPEGAAVESVSCQIVWNGEIVVDETSESGTVTCRYDAD